MDNCEIGDLIPFPVIWISHCGKIYWANLLAGEFFDIPYEKNESIQLLSATLGIEVVSQLISAAQENVVQQKITLQFQDKFFIVVLVSDKARNGILFYWHDISEIKISQEQPLIDSDVSSLEMVSSHDILANILENLPLYVYWKDKNSIFRGCNKLLAEFFGFSKPEDLIGKTEFQLTSKENAEKIVQNDQYILLNNKKIIVEETVYDQNKSQVTGLSYKAPLIDRYNKIQGIIGITLDITEKKKLEGALSEKNAELEQLLTGVLAKYKNFVLNQEHDIRTPVSSVIGLADTLLGRLSDPEDLEIAQLLLQSAQAQRAYQNTMVDSLYLFEKKTERYSRRFELLRKLEEIRKMFLCTFYEKQLKFSFDYDPGIPKKLVGDWFRLQQMMVCLLSNATKFTEPGGRIQLRCKGIPKAERRWVISIELEDTGVGIEESQLNTIFEPFVRLSLSNLGKYYGRGLGLTFVKKMVEELEGEIDVVSTVGKGSVFYLLIPFTSSWSEESPSLTIDKN